MTHDICMPIFVIIGKATLFHFNRKYCMRLYKHNWHNMYASEMYNYTFMCNDL